MYLYIYKNSQFFDRIFINSSEILDEEIQEIYDKSGDECTIITSEKYYDAPSLKEIMSNKEEVTV